MFYAVKTNKYVNTSFRCIPCYCAPANYSHAHKKRLSVVRIYVSGHQMHLIKAPLKQRHRQFAVLEQSGVC